MIDKKIRVLSIDDQEFQNSLLKSVLQDHEIIDLVGTVKTDEEMYRILQREKVDLILLDIEMPSNEGGKDGIQIARELRNSKEYSHIQIICLTINTQSHVMRALIDDIGVDGYLDKNYVQSKEIIEAVQVVTDWSVSKPYVSENLRKKVKRILKKIDPLKDLERLTPREKEIIPLIAEGLSDHEIVKVIMNSGGVRLAPTTINTHRMNIYYKMECKNAAQIAKLYYDYMRNHNDDIDNIPNFKKSL